MRYDVREQACIPVAGGGQGGTGAAQRDMLSVTEVFRRCEDVTAVYGDTPGEGVALVEWLLGLVYAAGRYPRTEEEWGVWVQERRSLAGVADWLEQHPGCWDLFDPVEPLGQNALLAPHLDAHGVGPAQLFIERAGDYSLHFDHHHLHHNVPVAADAAFRAMLTQHVYGLGGRAKIKAKDMGLPAAFTNNAVCRLGGRLRVLALGDSLGDTLRLNLVPWEGEAGSVNLTWTARARRTFAAGGLAEARLPEGPADLHTVLGRSVIMRAVRLPGGALGVDRVLLGPGELLGALPALYLQDALTGENATGATVLLKPSAVRDLWRSCPTLYAAIAAGGSGGLYGRLARLSQRRVDLWMVGIIARQTKVTSWACDIFPYAAGRQEELREAAERCEQICEHAAKALYVAAATAREIAYPYTSPSPKPAQLARFNGEPQMWASAAPAVHAVLESVAEGRCASDVLADFDREVRDLAFTALKARLGSLSVSGRALQARARCLARFRQLLDCPKAPDHLGEDACASCC
ncbi:type I-E CRISPR-associated protein Cse1/CasA [Kitasatospora sp. GAS204B]|uniref:type I-E CRISPR-associated protein Cse1/CasA n=1 Tax=unclassified Kitasatospora TaxID=2633591 RepID=UPI002476F4DF|nr:type I-E CRISPR-associated protein Cse1/CasA [Kitasatospora sp. GAS204B]MDH6122824.1 CRISPR system Cascade subunit CasA [Kitasatospora sp. GAS204B]